MVLSAPRAGNLITVAERINRFFDGHYRIGHKPEIGEGG